MKNKDPQHVHIIITDIQLHSTEVTNPKSWPFLLKKSLTSKSPKRVYGKMQITEVSKPDKLSFTLPGLPTAEQLYQIPELRGKTVHFYVRKSGLPIFAGKDTIEKIEADKRNRNKRFDKLLRR